MGSSTLRTLGLDRARKTLILPTGKGVFVSGYRDSG